MLNLIDREKCLKKYKQFPVTWWNEKTEELDSFYPETYGGFVLTIPAQSFRGLTGKIGNELSNLAQILNTDSLIFLRAYDKPWRFQKSDYGPAIKALKYLKDNGVKSGFNGAIEVKKTELVNFGIHLAWMVRSVAALTEINFIDPHQNILASLCQYGNLHLYTMNKKTHLMLEKFVQKSNFEYLSENVCQERFRLISSSSNKQPTKYPVTLKL